MSLVIAVRAPLASNTLVHGSPQTITSGAGLFGSKSTALFYVRDTQTDTAPGTNAVSSQWTGREPNAYSGGSINVNMQVQTSAFTPGSFALGAPNPFVGGIIAGCHADSTNNSNDVSVFKGFTLPASPDFAVYIRYNFKSAYDWAFGNNGGDDNYKTMYYNQASGAFNGPNYWYWQYNDGSLTGNTLQNVSVSTNPGSPAIAQYPDGNGVSSLFWGSEATPFYNKLWNTRESEFRVTEATGLPGGGYYREYVNRLRSVNYAGRLEDGNNGTARTIGIINPYARSRGPNNFAAGADITIDSSASGVGAVQVARVLVGNASTYAACTILEPQVPISWATGSIPFTFWKGNLTTGSTGYVYVMTEAGVVETPDQPSFLIA